MTPARAHVVWHRDDLRVHDHPALSAAVAAGPTIGIVVLDDDADVPVRRRAFRAAHARALREEYRVRGGTLLVRSGNPVTELVRLTRALGAQSAHALHGYTPTALAEQDRARRALGDVALRLHPGGYIHEPGTVRTAGGRAYRVFAPFFRAWSRVIRADPLDAPARIDSPALPHGVAAGTIPDIACDVPLPAAGERAALEALEAFIALRLDAYAAQRDALDGSGGSRLSPWLAIGALSARTAFARVEHLHGDGVASWRRELAWRDFLADLLHDNPHMLQQPFEERWTRMKWSRSTRRFEAWRDGTTGIPAVDAAMRELHATGWISNRARMLAAQFLAKQLRIDWRRGERVFRDWLLDADTASNVGNWQWAAGLGIDNAPHFRVFNPVTQAQRYDPRGDWLQRWVPECGGDPRPLPGAIVALQQSRQEYLDAAKAAR